MEHTQSGGGLYHYLGVFGCYEIDIVSKRVLLGISPPRDGSFFSAQETIELLDDILSPFGPRSN
jgi:hypothetical protein